MNPFQSVLESGLESNVPVSIDEILLFGLDILVLREGVKNGEMRVKFDDYRNTNPFLRDEHIGYTAIDARLFADKTLGDGADDGDIEERYKTLVSRLYGVSEVELRRLKTSFSKDGEDVFDDDVDLGVFDSEWERTAFEYRFRPTELTSHLKKADVVIAHLSVAAKIRAEVPEANLAVIYTGEDIPDLAGLPQVSLSKTVGEFVSENYFGSDPDTVSLLFKGPKENRFGFYLDDYLSFRSHDVLAELFYAPLKNNRQNHHNPQERTTKVIDVNQIQRDKLLRRGEDEKLVDALIRFDEGPQTGKFIPNFYGLGNQYRIGNGATVLSDHQNAKEHEIRKFYEQLWLKPLSEAEAADRRETHRSLVENPEYFGRVRSLENAINTLIEPYLHLSSMAKLISANMLGSKWGATLEKQPFYDDFVRIAEEFTTRYADITSALGSLESHSREIKAMLDPLRVMFVSDSPFASANRFISDIVASRTNNYAELSARISDALRGASLMDELETYDPNEDPDARPLYFGKNKEDKKGSMRKQKSAYLQSLLDEFHAQNPISSADREIAFINSVGTRLAAFTAYAEFIRGQERSWVLPESAPKNEGALEVINGWYPLTLVKPGKTNVPNDIYFDSENRVMVVDGSNACGKTNYLFESAFIAQQARTGGYVPADYARVSHFDEVLCRLKPAGMGRAGALVEELHSIQRLVDAVGQSAFLAIDETYLSTNHDEGEALTYGTLRRFVESPTVRGIITSHYSSLHDILNDSSMAGVFFKHVEFEDTPDGIQFTYKVKDGPNRLLDYAIAIAVEEGTHPAVVRHAFEFLKKNGGIDGVNIDRIKHHIASGRIPEAKSIDGMVDEHTSELLGTGMRRRSRRLGDLFSMFKAFIAGFNLGYAKEFDEEVEVMLSTPLSDHSQIVDRLNTTEAFITDTHLRARLEKIATVFGADYKKRLLRNLGAIARTYGEDKRKYIDGYRTMIGDAVKAHHGLPKNFRRTKFATETLKSLSHRYDNMMAQDSQIREFFDYMIELDSRLKDIEGKLHVKKGRSSRRNPSKRDSVADRIGVTDSDLSDLVDVNRIEAFSDAFETMKRFFGDLYVYKKMADDAVEQSLVKPTVLPREANTFVIVQGRYENYPSVVPNSTRLHPYQRAEVLEGPNDGGKTCDLKKIGRIALRAQSGGFVPAQEVIYSIRDRIIMREKGKGDVISAFQTDCRYANEVVPLGDEYRLVLMDETFTSTEWKGGRALTNGIIRAVQEQGNSLVVISSHYRGLRDATYGQPSVVFSHFPIREVYDGEELKTEFPHRKKRGPLDDPRYALKVARANPIGWKGDYGSQDRELLFFDPTIVRYAENRLKQKQL